MTDTLTFVVEGEPCGKMRARTFVRHKKDGTPFVTTTTPDKTRAYESKVRTVCALAVNKARWLYSSKDRFAVRIDVYRTHEGVGFDADNYAKSCADAIQGPGLAMPDDRYVRELVVTVRQDAERPRLEVTVRRMRIGEMAERRTG